MARADAAAAAGAWQARPSGRALRWLGWVLVVAGTVVLLYLVYSLLYTNRSTGAAQQELRDGWEEQIGPLDEGEQPAGVDAGAPPPRAAAGDETNERPVELAPGDAVAVIQFHRPGADPPVHDGPLLVVAGVSLGDLAKGPGHYPTSALPGEDGNFAVAGHRTTYGAPFFHLDQLRAGDEILVTDRSGRRHVYHFAEQRIVAPTEVGVISSDPLGSGRPTLTLTTCHPRFSARQRLVVFAELAA